MRTEEEQLRDDARARRLLAGLPGVAPGVTGRVRARLARPATAPSRGRLVAVAGVTAAAAAAVLFVATRALEPAPAPPAPVAIALAASSGWATDASLPYVALSFDGTGAVEGTTDAPKIRWDSGTINVEVASGHGVKLSVETREAEVRVVGTGFTVKRDALGTAVNVRHGRVEVDCGEEVTRVLEVGDAVTCLPRSAAGLLLRARTLYGAGAAPATVLETVERGLAVPDASASVVDELATTRLRVLLDLGRHAEVLRGARTYLASPAALRRSDVELLAASAALELGGCASAAPWLLGAAPGARAACGD